MRAASAAVLPDRGLLRIDGEDRIAFLQGLVSNDVSATAAARSVYAAFLTPQGKFLHDIFIVGTDRSLLLDCESARREDLRQRLLRYRLRSRVELADVTEEWIVAVAFDGDVAGPPGETGAAEPFGSGIRYVDPRCAAAGLRFVLPRGEAEASLREAGCTLVAPVAYETWRLHLGLPDGSRDMTVEKDVLLECGFDALNGIDWQKGCYLGQEVTARTRYRGLVKRLLLPVNLIGPQPSAGPPVLLDGREVGELRSMVDGLAMAMLRLEAVEAAEKGAILWAGTTQVVPRAVPWLRG